MESLVRMITVRRYREDIKNSGTCFQLRRLTFYLTIGNSTVAAGSRHLDWFLPLVHVITFTEVDRIELVDTHKSLTIFLLKGSLCCQDFWYLNLRRGEMGLWKCQSRVFQVCCRQNCSYEGSGLCLKHLECSISC